jgi:hypothetical protein
VQASLEGLLSLRFLALLAREAMQQLLVGQI